MLRNFFSASFFLITSISFSQNIPLIHSGEVITKGKSLKDSSKYAEAIKEFLKVPERDTNYVYMLSEVTSAYLGTKEYDKVLSICEQQLTKPSHYAPVFLRHRAAAYDKSGQFDKAVAAFDDAIKKYPADYDLLFDLGITYYNHKNYEQAAAVFFKVISLYPFHAGSHLNLGRMAIGQGRKVHAMFSFGIYLNISNSDNARLVLLNNFLDNQVTDEGSLPLFGTNEPEKLDQIIRAKIAMDKNFKSVIPVDAAVVRQYEMLFQQLNSIQYNTADPWISAYYPIYKFVKDNNLVEPFIYHLLNSSANTTAKKWLSKNSKALTSFFQSVNVNMKQQREVVSFPALGFSKPVHAWYDSQNKLEALGDIRDDKVRQGHWNFFHDNFQLSAAGDYNEKGIKTSVWKYYNDDGTIVIEPRPQEKDPELVAQQALSICAGSVESRSGRTVQVDADTICIHGDRPNAVAIATHVRDALAKGDIAITPIGALV